MPRWPRAGRSCARCCSEVDTGPWLPFAPEEEGVLEQYAALYEWHMAAENEQVFPAAARQLDAEGTAAMGAEMAARRGVRPSQP